MKKVTVFLLLLSTACAHQRTITPRQNFVNELNAMVGANLSKYEIHPYKLGYKGDLKRTRQLPNGHSEKFYQHKVPQGVCNYVFEVDEYTNQIVSARIENDSSGCILIP